MIQYKQNLSIGGIKMENSYLRNEAERLLKGRYAEALLMFLMVFALTFTAGFIAEMFAPVYEINEVTFVRTLIDPGTPSLYFIFSIISSILGVFTAYITQKYYIEVTEERVVDKVEIFKDGFRDQPVRTLVASILVSIFTFLWFLLFIIPGIIKGYAYSMWLYLLAQDPSLTASDAINESKELTKGFKMRIFMMDLYYILLYFAVMMIMVILFGFGTLDLVIFGIVISIFSILFIVFILPRYMTSRTLLFNEIYYGGSIQAPKAMPESPELEGLV